MTRYTSLTLCVYIHLQTCGIYRKGRKKDRNHTKPTQVSLWNWSSGLYHGYGIALSVSLWRVPLALVVYSVCLQVCVMLCVMSIAVACLQREPQVYFSLLPSSLPPSIPLSLSPSLPPPSLSLPPSLPPSLLSPPLPPSFSLSQVFFASIRTSSSSQVYFMALNRRVVPQ